MFSSCPRYLYVSPSSIGCMTISFVSKGCRLLTYLPFTTFIYAHLSIPKSIQISRENVVTRSNSFLMSISLLANNFRSSTKKLCVTFDLRSSPKEYPFNCPNTKESGFTERINNNTERLSPWNIPLA